MRLGSLIRSEVFHGIRSVDPGLWDSISDGHPYAGREWCLYGEAVLGCEGYYVILSRSGEPVGGACFSVLYQEQIPFSQPAIRSIFERYLQAHPLLTCRTAPNTNFSGLFLPSSPELRQPSLDAIRTAALDIVHSCGASFALFDYLDDTRVDLGWDRFTLLRDFLDVGTRLDISWDTFDDYMEHIKASSLSRRKWLKRNVKKSLASGIEVRFDRSPEVDDATRLHQNVEKQYNEVAYPYTRESIDHARQLPDVVWMTAWQNDRLVASELLLHDAANHVCTPTLYGRDYDAEGVYFHTYYEVVRYAIEQLKVKRLVGNSGAYDFKHHLGFEPDRRNNLVFASPSSVIQKVSGWLSRMAG